jgi:hypothetical protein
MAAFGYQGSTGGWSATTTGSARQYDTSGACTVTSTSGSGGTYTVRNTSWNNYNVQETDPGGHYEKTRLREENARLQYAKNNAEEELKKAKKLLEKYEKDPVESLKVKVKTFELDKND